MPGSMNSSVSGKLPSLYGRRRECAVLDELLEQVRRGHSAVLVMRGEAGVGKTALLEYVARRAWGCRLERVTGVRSEMALAFAGLHQLCAPMLSRAECLPVPQREALRTAFGLGLEARCRALLSAGADADHLYREAIGRLSRTRLRPELARASAVRGVAAPRGPPRRRARTLPPRPRPVPLHPHRALRPP